MMQVNKNIVISVSGGRSSAMMARHISTHRKYRDYNKLYVFANTGMERPETIDFLKDIQRYWNIDLVCVEGVYSKELGVGVKHKVVDIDDLDMNAKPFEGAIKHKTKGAFKGLPNMKDPYCSEMTKSLPIKSFSDEIFGKNNYKMAIGMRAEDMPKRITLKEIEIDKRKCYPLIRDFEVPVGIYQLNKFWNKEPFQLEIHSSLGNCELCWKKSDKKIADDIRYGTRFIEWFERMEEEYNGTMFRGNRSIKDMVKLSELPQTKLIDFEDPCVCNF